MPDNAMLPRGLSAHFFKQRNKERKRRFLIEQLQDRLLLAIDLMPVPQESDLNIEWWDSNQVHSNQVQSASALRRIEDALAFNIKDAQRISLAYENSSGVGAIQNDDALYLYSPSTVDLRSRFNFNSHVQWRVQVSNPHVYSVLPTVDEDRLTFEVSGKAGLQSDSIVRVQGVGANLKLEFSLTIRIDNGVLPADAKATEQIPKLGMGGLLGEGEGSGGTMASAKLVQVDSDAAEPNLIYCGPSNNGQFNIELTNWTPMTGSIKVKFDRTITPLNKLFGGDLTGGDFTVDGGSGGAQVTYNNTNTPPDDFFTVTPPVLASFPPLYVMQ